MKKLKVNDCICSFTEKNARNFILERKKCLFNVKKMIKKVKIVCKKSWWPKFTRHDEKRSFSKVSQGSSILFFY